MKIKLISASVITAFAIAFWASAAHSQNRIITIPASCVDADTMARFLVEFDEMPALTMTTTREGEQGVTARHRTVLFINYKTNSWSLVETLSTGEFCITAAGEDITPFVKKK